MRMRLISMSSRQIAHGLEHGEIEAGLTYLDNEPLARVDTVPLCREHYLLVTRGRTASARPSRGPRRRRSRCAC